MYQLQGIGHVICDTRDRFVQTVRGILKAVFDGMETPDDANDDLTMSKVFRHKCSYPEVHKSSSLKISGKPTNHSDGDLKFGMKYIEKFNPLTRNVGDGFPD